MNNKNSNVLFDNPLLTPQNELIISPGRETENKLALVSEIEDLTTLNKQKLAVKREQVQLEVDNKKLDTAKKTVSALELVIDAVGKPETIKRVVENIKTPMDMKMMADAAEKLSNTLKNLSVGGMDEFGNKKKQKINIMFKSSGAAQAAVQIDTSHDE